MRALMLALAIHSQAIDVVPKDEAERVANTYRKDWMKCEIDLSVSQSSLERALLATKPAPEPRNRWQDLAIAGLAGIVIGAFVTGAVLIKR